jgi:hypothetical protein
MGTVDAMAKRLGTTLRRMRELNDAENGITPTSPQWKGKEAALQELRAGLPQIFEVLRDLPRLERDPAKAAQFYSTMFTETAELDDATRARIRPAFESWVKQLQEDALTLAQRPKEPKAAVAAWDERRVAAMHAMGRELQAIVPADKTEQMSMFETMFIQPGAGAGASFDIMTGRNK